MEKLSVRARNILQTLSKREKVDLSTPRGWSALMEATFSKRFTKQLPHEKLVQLRTLGIKWQFLYHELRFQAATRPVWNT